MSSCLSFLQCHSDYALIIYIEVSSVKCEEEFSDEEDDNEIIALVPQKGLFASGNTKEEAIKNLLISMEDDYLRLKEQRNSLGHQLLLKLEFFEAYFRM